LADENKSYGGGWQSAWHFKSDNNQGNDVVTASTDIYNWLRGGSSNSRIVQTIISHTKSTEEAKSLGLRLLAHYIGDIHQPLHAGDIKNA
jgi:hypothetical protein